jgi:ABC-type nitrate/sulfonate/bicarbonate transport system ATPase subunit
MLNITDISLSFGPKQVLNHLSLSLPETGSVALMGESGCGKTTLLMVLAGLLVPESGDLAALRQIQISAVFQEDRLLNHLTARENIELVLNGRQMERTEQALLMLKRVGLLSSCEEKVKNLSGGMKRRVALARALAPGSEIVLLDEPFQGLDPDTHVAILQELFIDSRKRLLFLITHDISDADALNASIWHMKDGLLERGPGSSD